MFKKQVLGCVLLWCLLTCACLWLFIGSSSEAQQTYWQIIDSNQQAKKDRHRQENRMTQQTRYKVSKQILYKQDAHRMQSRLTSARSELFFDQESRHELSEHFQDLTCLIQEKLLYRTSEEESIIKSTSEQQPMQYMRYLKAYRAVYSYQTSQLNAENVEIARYLIPSHCWASSIQSISPLLQGHAEQVEMSLLYNPYFKAQGFQATFRSWEKK